MTTGLVAVFESIAVVEQSCRYCLHGTPCVSVSPLN